MGNAIEKVKAFVNKTKDFFKKIANTIKFFATPLGTVVAWAIIIIFIAILFVIVGKVLGRAVANMVGVELHYSTYETDLDIINQLNNSGYEKMADSENFQNYKAFEYAVLMDAAGWLANNEVPLLSTVSEYDMTKLTDEQLEAMVEAGRNNANYSVTAPKVGGQITSVGGNTRVAGPFLIYRFEKPKSGKFDDLTTDKFRGNIKPYVYCLREDIKFNYYFEGNKVVEVKRELNVNNPELGGSKSRAKTVQSSVGSDSIRVYPDEDYPLIPFYTSTDGGRMYKIPLITLLGRYMAKAELLHAWSLLKEDVGDEKIINNLITNIKSIYNEACLEGETFTTVQEGDEGYAYASTNSKTFVKFKKVGLELSKFGKMKEEMTEFWVVDDLADAVVATNSEITITDTASGQVVFDGDFEELINLSDAGFSYEGATIEAEGSPEAGYIPPSSFDNVGGGFYAIGEDDPGAVENRIIATIKDAAIKKLNKKAAIPYSRKNLVVSGVQTEYKPVFKLRKVKSDWNMDIKHKRMPALFVDEATTWAREIKYTFKIKQNPFYEDKKQYIIPNCKSSMGLNSFEMKLVNEKNYRGKAYADVFGVMKEKDMVTLITQLENSVEKSYSDCYEYIRDAYKLMQAAKECGAGIGGSNGGMLIHPNTYDYVYIPKSILNYDDTITQKIYWLELIVSEGGEDLPDQEEISSMRTKGKEITWQVIDYENLPECDGQVYALFPFGSPYVRAIYNQLQKGGKNVTGNYNANCAICGKSANGHNGADWFGRVMIRKIRTGAGGTDVFDYGRAVKSHAKSKYQAVYGAKEGSRRLEQEMRDEELYMPIVAVAPGKVIKVSQNAVSGFAVYVEHAPGIVTIHVHMKRWPMVAEGDYVGAGTLLGYEGTTGRSGVYHIHFMVQKNGQCIIGPMHYCFPIFNPFFYKEKAEAEGYAEASEYTSLVRTVDLDDGSGVTNQVPEVPLVDNVAELIQRQGETDKEVKMGGSLGWNKKGDATPEYGEKVRSKGMYDMYLPPEYFESSMMTPEPT